MQKAMGFVLAVHVPMAALSLLPVLFGLPLLFMPRAYRLSGGDRRLRAHQRNRFLLTAPPLRRAGAVGSPATPVGTV